MIQEEYFQWIVSGINNPEYIDVPIYSKLLSLLHSVKFEPILPMDSNRAANGMMLRYHFKCATGCYSEAEMLGVTNIPDGCTMLELMLSLCVNIEDTMSNSDYGNRTALWFVYMLRSMGLENCTDDQIDYNYALSVINRVNYRAYEPDGRGGLFTIPNSSTDLRQEELWFQANRFMEFYLQNIENS